MSLHVLSKHVACWLVSVRIVQHCVTHVAQNTQHCEIAMQDNTILSILTKYKLAAYLICEVLHCNLTIPSVLCNMSDMMLNNSNTDKPASNMLTQNMQ